MTAEGGPIENRLELPLINMTQAFLKAKKEIIERLDNNVLDHLSQEQLIEPRGNYRNQACEVIRPKTTPEVSKILSILHGVKRLQEGE